jgi:microcystin-dependent protein
MRSYQMRKSVKQTVKKNILAVSLAFAALPAAACGGSDPFLGSICTFGFNFCPRGWAEANGALLPIGQNNALFALLGTQFGGNGQTTFALPDLRGRSVVGQGQGPGLSPVFIGETGGNENVLLAQANMPAHTHTAFTTVNARLRGTNSAGTTDTPGGNVLGKYARTNTYSAGASDVDMGNTAIAATATTTLNSAGGNAPFNVRPPYLGMITCIATEGIFPSRN